MRVRWLNLRTRPKRRGHEAPFQSAGRSARGARAAAGDYAGPCHRDWLPAHLAIVPALFAQQFPEVRQPAQLIRDPHILGWIEHLWMSRVHGSGPPLRKHTRAAQLIRLRKLLDLLADHAHPPKPGWLWSEDIPRPDQLLPRPLTPEQDAALQTALGKRNDLLSNALLLMRLTGLRIGECADLAPDCLRHLGEDRWAIHVPVGKLHTERWVPGPEGTPEEGAR
jgi:integrase